VSELTLTVLRLGFIAVLWVFVLAVAGVMRADLFGQRVSQRAKPPKASAPKPVAPKAKRGTARTLVVVEGALAGTPIALADQPVTIGRAPDSTLVLDDDYVSSRHARLMPQQGRWLIEDMGSTNGTYLDRSRVSVPTVVPLGTPIRIGKTVLELRK
jgi:pSer/pThr/pTyr-binding forkhead associated (FHA) protein